MVGLVFATNYFKFLEDSIITHYVDPKLPLEFNFLLSAKQMDYHGVGAETNRVNLANSLRAFKSQFLPLVNGNN